MKLVRERSRKGCSCFKDRVKRLRICVNEIRLTQKLFVEGIKAEQVAIAVVAVAAT